MHFSWVFTRSATEGGSGFSRVCPTWSVGCNLSFLGSISQRSQLFQRSFQPSTWTLETFYAEESAFLESRWGKDGAGTFSPGRRKSLVPVNIQAHGCTWGTFYREAIFWEGQFFLCLIQPLVTWADTKLPALGASIRILGFCIHGNACFTYHFISNNGELNTWCEAIRFQVGGGGGKTVSPSGSLSDRMPNAMHLREGVDRERDSLLCVIHKNSLSLPSSLSLLRPCMLIASQNVNCVHAHTQTHT